MHGHSGPLIVNCWCWI